MTDASTRQDSPPLRTERELRAVTRDVAQCVRKPDVGALLTAVGAEDPLPDETKKKRIAAAMIATQHLEGHGGVVDRLLDAADAYDQAAYVEDIKRVAERVVGHDRITLVGQANASSERVYDDGLEPPSGTAFVGLTHWGGSSERLPRSILLMVTEGSRETQIELSADEGAQLIEALTVAWRAKADGDRYLRDRRGR
jgi:hypothetical protein